MRQSYSVRPQYPMDIEAIKRKAEALAKPSVELRRTGDASQIAALWGGCGVVSDPGPVFQHWLSVDVSYMPAELGLSHGVLSVYTHPDDQNLDFAAYEPSMRLPTAGGVPLYAHRAKSIPPPDALIGGEDGTYVRYWQSKCPMYRRDVTAVLGGWHFPWPDGDWEALKEHSLFIWTLDDCEPWVEVWKTGSGYKVMERIS
ncbi:MAG: hypothetical protein ISP45_26550 [Reyranella sp.]|nr:hypothetical protein [Reyranella sp.]